MAVSNYSPNYKPTILLLDGAFLIRRAMYAPNTRSLSNKQGMPTGGIYTFFNSLNTTVMSMQCNSIVICWEGGHSRRREEIYPQYKEKIVDPDVPPEVDSFGMTDYEYFNHQMSWIEKILSCYGVPQLRVSGKEGDDTLYQATRLLKGNKVIVSEDRDFFSLIREDISCYRPIKKEYVDIGNFEEITGYGTPRHFLYAKSILGDGSDNIPSVAKGVGDTTVMSILAKIENEDDVTTQRILKEASLFNKARHNKLVAAGADLINRNLDLIDISKESFDIFQLRSMVETLENKSYPDIHTIQKLFGILDFGPDTIKYINSSLLRMNEFCLSPLVNKGYLKEVALMNTNQFSGLQE